MCYNVREGNEQCQNEIQARCLLAGKFACISSDRAKARERAKRVSRVSTAKNIRKVRSMTIIEEIQKLKKEKDAVILAHYYVDSQIQDIADYIGDSFYLGKVAAGLQHQTIVFCGVRFMGESAKVLNPDKTVLLPDMEADCPMAHMADELTIKKARENYEDLAVVCYINSTAELKALSDVCVTSANALEIVKNLPNKNILFIPDRNLAHYIAELVPEKHFIFNEGFCPIHEKIQLQELQKAKELHPQAQVLSHPECTTPILEMSDYVGSTTGIIVYAAQSTAKEFIVCTEEGVGHQLRTANPKKEFYFVSTLPVCHDMKKITLEKILHVLKTGENEVHVSVEMQEASRKPLEKMLELAK